MESPKDQLQDKEDQGYQFKNNRKQRRNFDRIKRKAKKALMKAGYKVKR